MTAVTAFVLRPLERTSGSGLDQAAFRIHLSAKELANLGLAAGDLIHLSTANGPVGFGLAWLAQQTNPGNKPIAKVSDLLREKYGLALTDGIFIEKVHEAPQPVTSVEVSFSQTSHALKRYSTIEELAYWTKLALSQLEILAPGCTFDVEKRPKSGSKLRMTVTKVESDLEGKYPSLFHFVNSQVILPTETLLETTTAAQPTTLLRMDGSGIGGLSDHIKTINENLARISSPNFPLWNPRSRGPTSFLLHGPEGCGKTMLLKRLSEVSWRKIFRLDANWLAHNRKDHSRALSEDVFDAALRQQPSLILIDNLDKFLQKAESLMDRIQSELEKLTNTKVVVAAACRSIYDIDKHLRSVSGLRIQLELFPPNVDQREDIFLQLLSLDPVDENLNLKFLAERCHGFVGRDINDLICKARYHCDERVENSLDPGAKDTLNEALANVPFVKQEDFDAVIDQIEPTVLKDSVIQVPKVKWSDIAGVDEVRALLESMFVRPYKFPDLDKEFGAPQSRKGVLLYGPPGCAKTLIAQAVATESNQNFLAVKGSELIKMYVGESERAIRDVFRRARAAKPCIIFFDEIDSIGKARDKTSESGLNVVATLLNEMDGIEALRDVFIIGATNRPDILDSALTRAGRFDLRVHIGLPTQEARRQIFKIHTRNWPLAGDVDLDVLASKTEGSSGADIKGLCANVVELAKTDRMLAPEKPAEVRMSHFDKALEEHMPHTLAEEAARFEGWRPGKSLAVE